MKKRYFIDISYRNHQVNKFAFTIVKEDIKKRSIIDIAEDVIRPECDRLNIDIEGLVIHIKAFNRV